MTKPKMRKREEENTFEQQNSCSSTTSSSETVSEKIVFENDEIYLQNHVDMTQGGEKNSLFTQFCFNCFSTAFMSRCVHGVSLGLAEGVYDFPFQFWIPTDLPGSADEKYGNVRFLFLICETNI